MKKLTACVDRYTGQKYGWHTLCWPHIIVDAQNSTVQLFQWKNCGFLFTVLRIDESRICALTFLKNRQSKDFSVRIYSTYAYTARRQRTNFFAQLSTHISGIYTKLLCKYDAKVYFFLPLLLWLFVLGGHPQTPLIWENKLMLSDEWAVFNMHAYYEIAAHWYVCSVYCIWIHGSDPVVDLMEYLGFSRFFFFIRQVTDITQLSGLLSGHINIHFFLKWFPWCVTLCPR